MWGVTKLASNLVSIVFCLDFSRQTCVSSQSHMAGERVEKCVGKLQATWLMRTCSRKCARNTRSS